ncbi:MAG: hypothetical protein P8100_15190, partial [bacterium]
MKKPKFKTGIIIAFLGFSILAGCAHFDFIIQPFTADPDSSFDVQIMVSYDNNNSSDYEGYFGVTLPV